MSRFPFPAVLALSLLLLPAAPASADDSSAAHVYDTVDRVQSGFNQITITGIINGQSTPTTLTYAVETAGVGDPPARCDRFALLAMSKPGKFQFATVLASTLGPTFYCALITRAP